MGRITGGKVMNSVVGNGIYKGSSDWRGVMEYGTFDLQLTPFTAPVGADWLDFDLQDKVEKMSNGEKISKGSRGRVVGVNKAIGAVIVQWDCGERAFYCNKMDVGILKIISKTDRDDWDDLLIVRL